MATPPPEKAEAVSLRTKIVLSFWVLILLAGIPTWHFTTSIYRASLNLGSMLDENTVPTIPLPIWVLANNHFTCDEVEYVRNRTQAHLDQKNSYLQSLVPVLRVVHEQGSARCGHDIQTLSDVDPAMVLQLELTKEDDYGLELIPGTDTALVHIPSDMPPSVTRHLADAIFTFFLPEQLAHALQMKSQSINDPRIEDFIKTRPLNQVQEMERQMARAAKASPIYHLSFSLITAGGAPSSWEVQRALENHIKPLISSMAASVDVKITTQIQLYSSYSPSIEPFQVDNGFQIKQNDLTAFVNAAEWPLSPSAGSGPTLNLILYVPARDQIPLSIEGGASTGWLVPQWGAITILNPSLVPDSVNGLPTIPTHLTAEHLQPAFETFASQLLSLLGVLEYEGHHSLPLRLRAHKRFTGLALSAKASSSLASLARVAKHLRQIPIPRHVAQLVDNSMANLTAFTTASKNARWSEAVEHAADAYVDSEKAFFDKSMVGQVYFPDEHKVAVYLPLLGPIGVPLLVGLVKEIKRFVAARKATPKAV